MQQRLVFKHSLTGVFLEHPTQGICHCVGSSWSVRQGAVVLLKKSGPTHQLGAASLHCLDELQCLVVRLDDEASSFQVDLEMADGLNDGQCLQLCGCISALHRSEFPTVESHWESFSLLLLLQCGSNACP